MALLVVAFVLPSSGERWNWPVEDEASASALCEILDRANIPWSATKRGDLAEVPRDARAGG